MIRLTKPWLGDEEANAIAAVLDTGMLVQGKLVQEFEERLAQTCERKYAIAVSSGTSALQLSLDAIGVGVGDEVPCAGLSWPSPAHAIALSGATPVLVDVDENEWNTPAQSFADACNERTKAVIAIDQFGNPIRGEEIQAAIGDIPIVEDAACGLGSSIDAKRCGSFGLVSCLSFHPRKVITTGEGGACLTDDQGLADELRVLRNHGQDGRGGFSRPAGNYRLTEMAAAMGLAQLDRLAAIVEGRRRLAERYISTLPEVQFQKEPDGGRTNYQTMGALLPFGSTTVERDALVQTLRSQGVEAGALSFAMDKIGSLKGPHAPLPTANDIMKRGFALPLYPTMTQEDQDTVINTFKEVIK